MLVPAEEGVQRAEATPMVLSVGFRASTLNGTGRAVAPGLLIVPAVTSSI
jgi:hypothetical protein